MGDDTELAAPFQTTAVTSSFAVANGLVDLKRAASFYDRIKIIDHDVFEPRLETALESDYEWLLDQGLIEVEKVDVFVGLSEGNPGFDYAQKIQNGFAAGLFSVPEVRAKTHEVIGNGMARLHAAILHTAERGTNFTPIVTSRKLAPSLKRSVRLDKEDPLPRDEALEELLPIRATATRLVFDSLPVPGPNTPWDDVLRLRQEDETGLYASRLRILLQKLSAETDRRHVEDLIRSEYADFEERLKAIKGRRRKVAVQLVLPWSDLLHMTIKAALTAKLSDLAAPFLKADEELVKLNSAEVELKKDPFYIIEHVRSRLSV